MPKGAILTQEALEERSAYWQKVLRLQDWNIQAVVVRRRDMELECVQGECEPQLSNKRATIRLLDPVDYLPDNEWPQDMERTLVHELLHLHMEPFCYDLEGVENGLMEQAICCIADGLVALHRGR